MVHGKERRGSESRNDEVALALCIHKHLVNESYVSVDVLYTIRHVASFFKDGGPYTPILMLFCLFTLINNFYILQKSGVGSNKVDVGEFDFEIFGILFKENENEIIPDFF